MHTHRKVIISLVSSHLNLSLGVLDGTSSRSASTSASASGGNHSIHTGGTHFAFHSIESEAKTGRPREYDDDQHEKDRNRKRQKKLNDAIEARLDDVSDSDLLAYLQSRQAKTKFPLTCAAMTACDDTDHSQLVANVGTLLSQVQRENSRTVHAYLCKNVTKEFIRKHFPDTSPWLLNW